MTAEHPAKQKTSTSKINPKHVFYGIIILLGLGISYLLFRNWQLTNQFRHERNTMRVTAKNNQLLVNQQQLTFSMKTFAWAVRNALLQNKAGEINEYFNTLVKDKGVQEMLLVDAKGMVTLSTNKKNQGILFANRFPGYLLQQQTIYFNNKNPYELSAPVMSTNKRLGTLIMFYKPIPILPSTLTDN
ncbi:hypothetical protein GCM10028808_20370 [Spirosoma migulaei]